MDVTNSSGLGHLQKGHGTAIADIDNDGDQDIYCSLGGFYKGDVFNNALFQNPGTDKNWITLRLEGTKSNRSAVGARVRLALIDEAGKPRYICRTVSSGGTFGGNSFQLEVGIGNAKLVEQLVIDWPIEGGKRQTFQNLTANNIYQIKEGDSVPLILKIPTIEVKEPSGKHHHH